MTSSFPGIGLPGEGASLIRVREEDVGDIQKLVDEFIRALHDLRAGVHRDRDALAFGRCCGTQGQVGCDGTLQPEARDVKPVSRSKIVHQLRLVLRRRGLTGRASVGDETTVTVGTHGDDTGGIVSGVLANESCRNPAAMKVVDQEATEEVIADICGQSGINPQGGSHRGEVGSRPTSTDHARRSLHVGGVFPGIGHLHADFNQGVTHRQNRRHEESIRPTSIE